MTDENPDGLDLILNASLREYSNAEPRAGLELRVLRHVRARPHRRFAWALVVAAIAVIVLTVMPARRAEPPPLALSPPPVPQAVQPAIPAQASRERTSAHSPFRRSKEPEPVPLTAEERALLRLVQKEPEEAVAVLFEPAELEALTIEPLEIEGLQ